MIYSNWEIIENVPKEAELIAFGLDFGFTNHETAIAKVYVNGKDLIIDEVLYGKGISNIQIATALKDVKVGSNEVVADSAEPKSIAQLFDLGINVVDAIKGKDSVLAGIQKVKEYNIKITAKSRNGIRELKHYRWKMDRNGESLNEPVKVFDHLLDAVRYVVQTKLMVRKVKKFRLRSFKMS